MLNGQQPFDVLVFHIPLHLIVLLIRPEHHGGVSMMLIVFFLSASVEASSNATLFLYPVPFVCKLALPSGCLVTAIRTRNKKRPTRKFLVDLTFVFWSACVARPHLGVQPTPSNLPRLAMPFKAKFANRASCPPHRTIVAVWLSENPFVRHKQMRSFTNRKHEDNQSGQMRSTRGSI